MVIEWKWRGQDPETGDLIEKTKVKGKKDPVIKIIRKHKEHDIS